MLDMYKYKYISFDIGKYLRMVSLAELKEILISMYNIVF